MMITLFLNMYLALASPIKSFPQTIDMQKFYSSLEREDLKSIKEMGPEGYKQLRAIMRTDSSPMAERWKAILALAKIGREESFQDLLWTQKQTTWYVRSAGLLALSLIEEDRAEERAKTLMSRDPALMVRATALQVLAQSPQLDRDFLWKELYNPINFHNGKSLSLRESILKVLSLNPRKSEAEKFLILTREAPSPLKTMAQQALARTQKL